MAVGVLGILLAIGAAAVIFARMHPTGAGLADGLKFGALLVIFQLGSVVLHSYMLLNVGLRRCWASPIRRSGSSWAS